MAYLTTILCAQDFTETSMRWIKTVSIVHYGLNILSSKIGEGKKSSAHSIDFYYQSFQLESPAPPYPLSNTENRVALWTRLFSTRTKSRAGFPSVEREYVYTSQTKGRDPRATFPSLESEYVYTSREKILITKKK